MSALRIARPGYPVILLDQGPAEGRISRHGGAAIQPVAEPWRVREARLAREATQAKAQQERRKKERPVCGKLLKIIGEPCARNPGHRWDCKSREALEAVSASRRTGLPLGTRVRS